VKGVVNVYEIVPSASKEAAETLHELADAEGKKFLQMFPRRGQSLTRARVVEAFQQAFEQIGGVSRFALWADTHPTDFYKLYSRLLPSNTAQEFEGDRELRVVHAIPPSPLDDATLLPAPPKNE